MPRTLRFARLAAMGALAGGVLAAAPPDAFRPLQIPGADLTLTPESNRAFRRLVIGLEESRTRYFMLPNTEAFSLKTRDPRVARLRRQLYWLNFELSHGQLMKSAPRHTRFFVAVPDPEAIPESNGLEEEAFREYLATRVGWSPAQIAERVRFFRVPSPVVFIRDAAEILGTDGRGRLVLGVGSDIAPVYREPVLRLASLFPSEFVSRTIGEIKLGGVNTEGGDLALSWLPEGRVGLLVGRHRILRWLERREGRVLGGVPLDTARIDAARAAFSKAFFGVETIVIGEEALRRPGTGAEELFHIDMVVNVVRGAGKAVAFVPTYRDTPVDAITHTALTAEVRARVQGEYDMVARQMAGRGYHVVRLPFSDDPVRSPVNVSRYVDPSTGEPFVLLGRYPYHFALKEGGPIAQFRLQDAFDDLELKVELWRTEPGDVRWADVEKTLRNVWAEMDRSAKSPNPEFDLQVRLYEENGVRVVPLPIYPTGAGGIHCLLLH